MPLLRRLAFVKHKPPSDLKLDEELFFCKFTNEVFRDYEAFFERTILCNSLVWTCKYTGRPGLTYQEALDSEARARRNLRTFPEALKRPVLFLATLTRRGRLADMCDDVFLFTKDRFFVGETVEVLFEDIRLQCTIVKVIPPSAEKIKEHGNKSESDDLNTSNEENDKYKHFGPDPSLYEYEVHDTKEDVIYVANGSDISRKKGLYTREKSKLFLKQHCDSYKCIWTVEESSRKKLKLASAFQDLFAGPLPCFTTTPAKKRSPNDKELYEIMKQKKKVYEEFHEAEKKKEKEKQKEDDQNPKLSNEERAIIREKIKLEVEEARMKKKLEKEKEREKQREERRVRAEYLKEWSRPRDDLECDDLKDLPKPKPLKTVVPAELFGDMAAILEFLYVFGDYLEIEDEFPKGVSFEILERALIEKDIQGPMCDLLHLFLGVLFRLQEEEDENEEEGDIDGDSSAAIDTSELGDDELDRSKTLNNSLNSSTLMRPQLYLGKPVRTLPLDNCTVTEVLRLHLVCSGSRTTASNAKFRYQQRGGFTAADDPGLDFKLRESALLQRLATEDVYILPPVDKLKILTCLCHQLLTYVSARDLIEDSCERLRLLRIELKQLQWAESRRDREEAHARYLHRLEQRAKHKDSDPKIKKADEIIEVIDSFKEARNNLSKNNSLKDERNHHMHLKNENEEDFAIESAEDDDDVLIIDEELTPEEAEKLREKQAKLRSKLKEEFLNKEKELLEDINEMQAITNIVPIGRDRAYRRFWQFKSLRGLFVEDDDEFKGNCLGIGNETNDILINNMPIKSEDDKSTNSDKENESFNGANNNIVHTTPVIMNGIAHLPHNTLISIDKPIINSHIWPKQEPNVFGCTGTHKNCPIHGKSSDRVAWGYYSSAEELDSLIEALNPRGFREGPLRELFICEKNKMIESMSSCPLDKEGRLNLKHKNCKKDAHGNGEPKLFGEEALEWMLRDMLFDIEERLYSGSLGTLKVQNRLAWKAALENKSQSKLIDNNDEQLIENGDSDPVVKQLARVLVEIVTGIEAKYLKPPLGDAEEKRPNKKADTVLSDQKKLKKKPKEENGEEKEEDDEVTDANSRPTKTMLDKWQESLKAATSLSQVFLHLATLERCVTWSRSALNARCRICRRKGDAEHMLLCDGCNRGHHMYCLKPPMKTVPEEDWFCTDCRPKVVHKAPRKKRYEESEEEYSSKDEDEESYNDEIYDASTEENSLNESSQMYTDGGGDLCAVCSSGGTLILCDRCPLAFHLKCADPPLKKVPRGKWECQLCTGVADKRGSRERLKSGKSTTKLLKQQKLEKRELAGTTNKLKKLGQHKSELGIDPTYRNSPGNKRKRLDSSDSPENDSSKKRSSGFEKKSRLNQSSDEDSDKNGIVRRKKGKKSLDTNDSASRRSSIGLRGSDEGRDIKLCEDLLAELCKHSESWPFLLPVNKKDVPDYYLIIKKPMDFATMRAKMNNLRYLSSSDFLADARLIFKNCETYNMPTAPEAKAGVRLLKFLERRVHNMKLQSNSPTTSPNSTLKNSEAPAKRSRMI